MKWIGIPLIIFCLSYLRILTEAKAIFDRIDRKELHFNPGNRVKGNEHELLPPSVSVSLVGAKSTVRLTPLDLSFNDVDDVIHIIEPPRAFQDMKNRLRQQHQHHQYQQQHIQYQPIQHQHIQHQHQPKPMSSSLNSRVRQVKPKLSQGKQVTTTKVKDRELMSGKVEKPEMFGRLHKNYQKKAAITATNHESATHDLLMQGTRNRPENQLPQEAIIPFEILASVRKTERLKNNIKKQKHQQQHKGLVARQRVKMQKSHTVIMENGYENSRYTQGHENRAGGLYESTQKTPQRSKRTRRDIARIASVDINSDIVNAQKSAALNLEEGSQILARLDALLQFATRYVPDDNDTATHNNVLDELRTRFHNEFEPKQLIGEIEPTPKVITRERELIEILESSLNATGTIMQELMQKKIGNSISHEDNKCNSIESSSNEIRFDDSTLQQLQTKIDCMRQQLFAVREKNVVRQISTYNNPLATTTTTTTTTPARGKRRFTPQRTRSKSALKSTTTTVQSSNRSTSSPFHKRARAKNEQKTKFDYAIVPPVIPKRQRFILQKARNHTDAIRNVSNEAGVLLYDDVMTNIRNMLEGRNFQTSPASVTQSSRSYDEEALTAAIDFIETASTTSSPSTLSIGASKDSNYFRDLNLYLNEVQRIVTRLPQIKKKQFTSGNNNNNNNNSSSRPDWYLIHEDGKISETQQQPSTVIFHRFPDIPNASVYTSNRSLVAIAPSLTSTKQYEEVV